jgi:hypothetical protein
LVYAGVVLILFYQSSSMLTKFKAEVKARFEEDHAPEQQQQQQKEDGGGKGQQHGAAAGGQARTAAQVRVLVAVVS